jgi:acylphosphatase
MSVDIKIKAKILCSGLVQGVGFRYFVFKKASKFGLTGYAKNLSNGDVEILVEGAKEDVQRLYHAVKQGPSRSNVEKANIETFPYSGDLIGFDLL